MMCLQQKMDQHFYDRHADFKSSLVVMVNVNIDLHGTVASIKTIIL